MPADLLAARALLLALSLVTALDATAAAPADCSALQAEVEQLRARVRTLEAATTALTPPSTSAAAPSLPGTAAKPQPVQTVVVEEPYSRTGCRKSLFEKPASAPWQDPALWLDLEKGQSAAAVEKLLGVEHYDERGGRDVVWHYGRCGSRSAAQVLFTDGLLMDWRPPQSQ